MADWVDRLIEKLKPYVKASRLHDRLVVEKCSDENKETVNAIIEQAMTDEFNSYHMSRRGAEITWDATVVQCSPLWPEHDR